VAGRLGTIFFSRLTGGHLPTDALATSAWVSPIPLAITFVPAFRLPMRTRESAGGTG
jgi:hypothetical protein